MCLCKGKTSAADRCVFCASVVVVVVVVVVVIVVVVVVIVALLCLPLVPLLVQKPCRSSLHARTVVARRCPPVVAGVGVFQSGTTVL